jgi:hypothetical protein
MPGAPTEGVADREWGHSTQPGVLLWPGLGSTAAYFSAIAPLLPGDVVGADPPGFGRSPPPDEYSYERLVDAARSVIVEHAARLWSATRSAPISRSASRTTPAGGTPASTSAQIKIRGVLAKLFLAGFDGCACPVVQVGLVAGVDDERSAGGAYPENVSDTSESEELPAHGGEHRVLGDTGDRHLADPSIEIRARGGGR